MKVSVFIGTSLDGFIARMDGSIDWLERANSKATAGEDGGYKSFISTVDHIVMGRNTFATVLGFSPWPYQGLSMTVLSTNAVQVPDALQGSVEISAEAPTTLVDNLAKRGKRHIYVDGGLTIQSFLRAGLVDELIITVVPVLIGEGRRLFGSLPADLELNLVDVKSYAGGFTQSRYQVLPIR